MSEKLYRFVLCLGVIVTCILAWVVVLSALPVTPSLVWLAPLLGGLILGTGLAPLYSAWPLKLKQLLSETYIIPTVRLVFGGFIIVTGHFML